MQQQEHTDMASLEQDLANLSAARQALGTVVVGQEGVLDDLLVTVIAGGHALIEGAPGLGKTLLVRTLADVTGLEYSRIQFTPDLMPADITGTVALIHDDAGRASTRFQPGPIFAQLVLADEINRATPKTQSALLEAMQERTVTVAGVEHQMLKPFFVMATQNPYEMEGTYTLPEAQIDRFLFKVIIEAPSEDVLDDILALTTGTRSQVARAALTPDDLLRIQQHVREVPIVSHVRRAIARFVLSTSPHTAPKGSEVARYVRFGVSPRGGQSLVLAAKARALMEGRFNVGMDDVRSVLLPALRHRFQLNFHGVADGVSPDQLLVSLFEQHARAAVAA